MVEIVNFHIQKLKVVIVIRYLEEVIFWIKQCARRLQVTLVLVLQRRVKSRSRAYHRGVSGGSPLAFCTTTQNPPPQHPVPPTTPVSVYLHRNVHESMEMNQTVQAVSVVLNIVLLVVLIVIHLLVLVVLYHHVVKKMVLQPTMLPVNADLQNVLLLVRIVINLPIYVLQMIAEQIQLPRKLCQIVKLSINVVDVQNANPNGIQTTAPKLALIP